MDTEDGDEEDAEDEDDEGEEDEDDDAARHEDALRGARAPCWPMPV